MKIRRNYSHSVVMAETDAAAGDSRRFRHGWCVSRTASRLLTAYVIGLQFCYAADADRDVWLEWLHKS